MVIDLIFHFRLYLSLTWEEKERAKRKKEKQTHAYTYTYTHIAFIHSFLLLHWQTHTHTLSPSSSLTGYVMKNKRAKLHKSKKFLSLINMIHSICYLFIRTDKKRRKYLYWIRYQMQVSFYIIKQDKKNWIFFFFSCPQASMSDHAAIQVCALCFLWYFILNLFNSSLVVILNVKVQCLFVFFAHILNKFYPIHRWHKYEKKTIFFYYCFSSAVRSQSMMQMIDCWMIQCL